MSNHDMDILGFSGPESYNPGEKELYDEAEERRVSLAQELEDMETTDSAMFVRYYLIHNLPMPEDGEDDDSVDWDAIYIFFGFK